MTMLPSILIVHASGTNRDQEAAWACEMAGGRPEIVHMNRLRSGERKMADYQMVLLPGGFSYGDALGAGSRFALDIQIYFHDQLQAFVDQGKPVLGICNGFQVLVKAGLLPDSAKISPAQPSRGRSQPLANDRKRQVTLTENQRGRFECRWVHLAVEPNCKAPALQGLDEQLFCPVAHGEGNLQATPEAIKRIEAEGLVAFRYVSPSGELANGTYPLNPNGSQNDIAGLCNAKGNVIGLMPHPEDHIVAAQNPLGRTDQMGLQLFKSLVRIS